MIKSAREWETLYNLRPGTCNPETLDERHERLKRENDMFSGAKSTRINL